MIAQGTLNASGICEDLEFTVGMSGRGNYGAKISGRIDSDCQVWVEQTTWTRTPPHDNAIALNPMLPSMAASAPNMALWYGSTKTELNDFAEIDIATAFADLIYWDDGSELSGGVAWHDCDVFPIGWSVASCVESENVTSPSRMYSSTRNNTTHTFAEDTYLYARFVAYPDEDKDHTCAHGITPSIPLLPPLHWHCRKEHFQVNS